LIFKSYNKQGKKRCFYNSLPMQKIVIAQNIRKDAWNWWDACNKVSYGEDWKQRIEKKIQDKMIGKTREQSFAFLIPRLNTLYKRENINQKKKEIQDIFDLRGREIFSRMRKVTGHKIYRENFTCFLTTFPRAPYNYNRGFIWIPIIWPKEAYVRTFVHELLHFQTYAYWEKRCLKS